MFEIRVICDQEDVPFIVRDLCLAFVVRSVRQVPARAEGRERLYIDAERRTGSNPR
ncbi:hypothetical protein ABZ746_01930 [Streptomyces sp. NPDC020096]